MPTPLPLLSTALRAADQAGSLGGTEGPDMTRYLLVCSGLLVGVALLAVGFRRLAGGSLKARAARRSLQVVDVLPLGGRNRLAVVRCYDRTFLLGMGEKQVSLVAELDAELASARTPLPDPADREAFERVLERAGQRAPGASGDGVLTPRASARREAPGGRVADPVGDPAAERGAGWLA